MDDVKLLADLRTAFEYAHLHEEWVSPLEAELDGLTSGQAQWRPDDQSKSIWAIVLHMAVWNENIVIRIETGENARPEEGAWPPLPHVADDTAWEAAKLRLRASIAMIDGVLSSASLRKIESSPHGLPDLLVRFIHVGYHVGQITKIREIMTRNR